MTTPIHGHTLAGRTYERDAIRSANQHAWLELSVFDAPPRSALEKSQCAFFDATVAKYCLSTLEQQQQQREEPVATTSNNNNNSKGASASSSPSSNSRLRAQFRIRVELFWAESPRTCHNFYQLCSGTFQPRVPVLYEGAPLPFTYKGTYFHKIIPKNFAQGGDLTHRVGGGSNRFSVYGATQFEDENLRRELNEIGLLGMANNGPNTNGSQFFITTGDTKEQSMHGRHGAFGRIVEGLDLFMTHVAKAGNLNGDVSALVLVSDCGVEDQV